MQLYLLRHRPIAYKPRVYRSSVKVTTHKAPRKSHVVRPQTPSSVSPHPHPPAGETADVTTQFFVILFLYVFVYDYLSLGVISWVFSC